MDKQNLVPCSSNHDWSSFELGFVVGDDLQFSTSLFLTSFENVTFSGLALSTKVSLAIITLVLRLSVRSSTLEQE